MKDFEIVNLLPEVNENEFLTAIEDKNQVAVKINSVLEECGVIEEKIYTYQKHNEDSDYIVFEVHQPNLEEEKYQVRIIAMSVHLRIETDNNMNFSICAEVHHLMTDDIRYCAW
jgi:hypothetical protein